MQKNVLEYLEDTVKEYSAKTAFSNGKEQITFGEVYCQSRAIGSFLAKQGYYGEPIAVIMDKHPRTVTAFFGIIYAGCFYVCIDEKMPEARMRAIFNKLSPRAVICDKKNEKTARALDAPNTYLYDDIFSYEADDLLLRDIRTKQSNTDAIYVVFTSGSTGTPKGVVQVITL